MLPGLETFGCGELAVPRAIMAHVVRIESSFNPFAIGVVGGRLERQPRDLGEAMATARALEAAGRNFSVGLAQVNRHNLARMDLGDYRVAFDACANLAAGARILADCHARASGDWGKAFSCYYSGDFRTGFRHGYVDRVFASIARERDAAPGGEAIALAASAPAPAPGAARPPAPPATERLARRRVATVPPGVSGDESASPAGDPAMPRSPSTPRDPAFVF